MRPTNRRKLLARLHSFRTARVTMNYLPPAFAVVMESFFPGVKDESDSLTVVAIEAIEIQEVAEYRRCSGVHLCFIQSARGIVGQAAGGVFRGLRIYHHYCRTKI